MTKRIAHNVKPLTTIVVLLVVGLLMVVSYWSSVAGAQSPAQVILTWQAHNFYPANYAGKALATPNTLVKISAEILQNNKLLDLSNDTFLWYVDEKLLTRGRGLKETSFTIKKLAGDSHFVRVAIEREEGVSESSTRIPVSKHRIVIESPYPNNLVETGNKILLQAIPYFFNISSLQDLEFFWQVNEEEVRGGSDNQLTINIGTSQTKSQNIVQVAGSARNTKNPLEFSSDRIRLTTY